MTISVCMITWNEEDLLPSALASAEGLADEVVVLDTGSSDRTVEVARSLGARVFTGGDRMHKATSRNRAQDEATGDWVVILDADEQIADPEGLRAFLETTDTQAVYIRLAFMNAQNQPTLTYQQMRCWRRGAFRYQYRAHEVPVPTGSWGKLAHTEFVWEHRPPPDRAWKRQYTLERLEMDVAENPGAARPLYYLGRQYMYQQMWDRAIETLERYVQAPAHDEADAWWCLAKCHGAEGRKREQVRALYQACAAHPGRREWWGELASLYHSEGSYQMAAGLLRCALEIPPPAFAYHLAYWYGPHIHDLLARCLWKLERYEEGYEQARIAVELAPDNERLRTNLRWFAGKRGQDAGYYDLVYRQIVEDEGRLDRIRAVAQAVAPHVRGSVLDLGCGVGLLADRVEGPYVGIDFSTFALEWARAHTSHPHARFVLGDLRNGQVWQQQHGTVVLAEVLEHVSDPEALVAKARRCAAERLIVTVPVDMPDPAHVKPAWSGDDLRTLLPGCKLQRITGGHRWLAVEECA